METKTRTVVLMIGIFWVLPLILNCGGSSENGKTIIGPNLDITAESELNKSQLEALRDLGLYDGFMMSGNPNLSSSKEIYLPSKSAFSKVAAASRLDFSETYSRVYYGIASNGSVIEELSCDGESGEDGINAFCTFSWKMDDYNYYGACDQIVVLDGTFKCEFDIHGDNLEDFVADVFCYTDRAMDYTGSDEILHKLILNLNTTVEGSFYDDPADYTSYTGLISVDDKVARIEELAEKPECSNPTVISCVPEDGSNNVSIDTPIVVTFSQEMNHESAETAIDLADGAVLYSENLVACNIVEGELSWNSTAVTYSSLQTLEYSNVYTLVIDESVKDARGYPLNDTFECQFTTADN